MVTDFYNLREQPFSASPDPRYFFASETHREALASLLYGIDAGRGFLALIAPPGMGKTTLLFRSLEQAKRNLRTVFLFQTISTPLEFIQFLLTDLGVDDVGGGMAQLQAKLIQILMELSLAGTTLIIVVDEAQHLDYSVLEFVRMLSNFETSQRKLMHIILAGQPELGRKLVAPEMVQLRQRISIIARLDPFTPDQTAAYVNHRLRAAGWSSDTPLFGEGALRLIAAHSSGIPRNINNLCFNALSLGCALGKKTIDADVLREVMVDLEIEKLLDIPAATPRHRDSDPSRAIVSARPLFFHLRWISAVAVASVLTLGLSGVNSRVSDAAERRAESPSTPAPTTAQPPLLTVVPQQPIPPQGPADQQPAPSDTVQVLHQDHQPVATPPEMLHVSENRLLMPPGMLYDQVCFKGLAACVPGSPGDHPASRQIQSRSVSQVRSYARERRVLRRNPRPVSAKQGRSFHSRLSIMRQHSRSTNS